MVVLGYRRAMLTDQKVQVAALICLQHVVDVKFPVTAAHGWCRRLPGSQSVRQLHVVHVQVQLAPRHV